MAVAEASAEAKVDDGSRSRRIVRRLAATMATQGYNPANANLHWSQRTVFRNSLTLVYSFIPQLPIVLCY